MQKFDNRSLICGTIGTQEGVVVRQGKRAIEFEPLKFYCTVYLEQLEMKRAEHVLTSFVSYIITFSFVKKLSSPHNLVSDGLEV